MRHLHVRLSDYVQRGHILMKFIVEVFYIEDTIYLVQKQCRIYRIVWRRGTSTRPPPIHSSSPCPYSMSGPQAAKSLLPVLVVPGSQNTFKRFDNRPNRNCSPGQDIQPYGPLV